MWVGYGDMMRYQYDANNGAIIRAIPGLKNVVHIPPCIGAGVVSGDQPR